MTIIGIDGCQGGWVVASSQSDLTGLGFTIRSNLEDIFRQARADEVNVIIDVPIGLSDSEPRLCDIEARRVLSRRHKSSVFPAPARPCLAASDDYVRASQLSREASGKSLSRQAFGILRKIREVDELIDEDLQRNVREAHPEVTFACLAGRVIQSSKKTREGERERLELLRVCGLMLDVEEVRLGLGRGVVAPDDVVDAAACLVTAQACVRNKTRIFPSVPCLDARGLRMEIIAPQL
jgi:predicted RNase H-like nuclease